MRRTTASRVWHSTQGPSHSPAFTLHTHMDRLTHVHGRLRRWVSSEPFPGPLPALRTYAWTEYRMCVGSFMLFVVNRVPYSTRYLVSCACYQVVLCCQHCEHSMNMLMTLSLVIVMNCNPQRAYPWGLPAAQRLWMEKGCWGVPSSQNHLSRRDRASGKGCWALRLQPRPTQCCCKP